MQNAQAKQISMKAYDGVEFVLPRAAVVTSKFREM